MKFFWGFISYNSHCPLIAYISMIFSILSPNYVTNEWNFRKLILNIYDHGEVMHMSFIWASSIIAELLPFDCLIFNDFFRPQP